MQISASIVTHAKSMSELTNLSTQSTFMLVTSAAISTVLQSPCSVPSLRASSLDLIFFVVSRVRNQASRGQVEACPCRSVSIARACILESCSCPCPNTFCIFSVMALQSAHEFHLVRPVVSFMSFICSAQKRNAATTCTEYKKRRSEVRAHRYYGHGFPKSS